RLLNDGTVGFLGRKDDQVKIRGFRIELGEIERVLLDYDGISGAAVLARSDAHGEKRLVAYVSGSSASDVAGIRTYLSRKLPEYMVPGMYVPLEQLPLTSNGKTDRKSLPDPETSQLDKGYTAPRNEVEEALVLIWAEVLGLEAGNISVKDNFFDLGGHSLKAIRIVLRIHEKFNVEINLTHLFTEPDIESLAIEVENILWLNGSEDTRVINNKIII
ncbi:phosphopantetheine-binding protein, partial [Pedobacter alluvionis]